MRISSNVIFSQYVVLLMTIFRTIGPLWNGNTADCSCSNNTKPPYVKWPGWDADAKKKTRKKKKSDLNHWDPKCYHSIMGDSDDFHLLMACKVPRRCRRESHAITHIGNPCLTLRLTIIFHKPNRPENVQSIIHETTPQLISPLEFLSHCLSAPLYNFIPVMWVCSRWVHILWCWKKIFTANHLLVLLRTTKKGESLFSLR